MWRARPAAAAPMSRWTAMSVTAVGWGPLDRNLLVLEQVKAAWIDAVYGAIILLALALSRVSSGEQE